VTTKDHTATWTETMAAANDRDWGRMASCFTPNAVLHYTKGGLGSTFVRFQGGEAIVEGHRKAVEEYGLTWELLGCMESEDLLATLVANVFGNGTRGLAANVVRFDDTGRVCEVYSHNKRPS
jgi:hypothetical protein